MEDIPAVHQSLWSPLLVPVFRALWIASLVANLGVWMQNVNDPRLKHGGLCPGSTATRHSAAAVPLWLHRPTHEGVSTTHPCWSSLAGPAAFSRQYCAHRSNQHGGCNGNSDRRTASPCLADSLWRYSRTSDRPGCYSGHPLSRPSSPPAWLYRQCSYAIQ